MSQIKTTAIEGDVAVGRNVTAGGNASVRGNMTVKKNLRVEGWLDARNIKGPNKGVFESAVKLREAYPMPHDGWWALVGNTLPASLYIADGGEWVDTGEEAGNLTVDMDQYNEQVNALETSLAELRDEVLGAVEETANAIESTGRHLDEVEQSLGTECETRYQEAVEMVEAESRERASECESLSGRIKGITDIIGEADGIAPLDEYGLVPENHLPEELRESGRHAITDDIEQLGDQLGSVQARMDSAQGQISELGVRADTLEDGLGDAYERLDGLTAGMATANEAIEQNRNNIAAVRKEVSIVPFDGILRGPEAVDEGMIYYFTELKAFYFSTGAGSGAWTRYNPYNTGTNANTRPRKELIYRLGNELYRWDGKDLVKVGGASVGNTYNLTVEVPTPDPEKVYYTMGETADKYYAPAVVLEQGKANFGLQITFAQRKGAWKIYQYIGTTLERDDFLNRDNWLDLAGLPAGTEPVININDLCGDTDYTLSLAIQALLGMRESSGIDYRKEGLVISYRRDASKYPHVWETKQFCGAIDDMTATALDLWRDFGGGGSIEITDEVTADDPRAVTSGGVHDALSRAAIVDHVDEGTAEEAVWQGVNALGEPVGNPIRFARSGGGGQTSGSALNIYPETRAVWAAFGGRIILRCAVKSVSFDGDTEIYGIIRTISIVDAGTGLELWSKSVNAPSSTSATDYRDDFTFDFTDFITQASGKDFRLRATDAEGNTRTLTVTVTAVDVTCSSIQTLNHTSATALEVGGKEKTLPMYKFANNVSTKQGILVTTEIYYNGEWRVLGTATVTDSYSHNISINPCNALGGGEQLGHGAYQVRIQGKDLASGVTGNTIYSTIMCVDPTSEVPLVALRYDDRSEGKIRMYDTLGLDVAAYTPGKTTTSVEVIVDGHVISSLNCESGQTFHVGKQVQGYVPDGTKTIEAFARSGESESGRISVKVEGSAIDARLKEGAVFALDFSTRSNQEADHTIFDGGVEMIVEGSNWNSNGFVNVLGEPALRIAENVKAEIPYAPFASAALETSGCAVQLAFSTKNIQDPQAKLCECHDPATGVGFYIRGNEVVVECVGGTPQRIREKFRCSEKVTVAVVVEPGSKYVTYKPTGSASGTNYAMVKLYVNGDMVGAIGYQPGTSALRQTRTITFNSEAGDISLYYVMAYNSHMEWLQAWRNYLCKLTDVEAMIAEYDANNVLDASGKPSMSMLAAMKIPYYVIVADQTTFDNFDYALNGGTSTSDPFACTLYYFNPEHPEVSFKAVNTLWRRQGTTSAQRPVKNDRFNFNKKNKNTGLKATVTLLYPDESTELGRKAILAAKHNKVYVSETGSFVDVVTVKVDYSDSSNANDCGVCDMMNATFRVLGSAYMTPAQRAYDGTQDLGDGDVLTGLEMDHSTKNHPVAVFRATQDNLTDAWFHAKGNWKEDKGEQVALGFKDTPGYNKGCLNYGDFIEFFGTPGESLAQTETRFKSTGGLDTGKVYLISQYCGRDYAIYRYSNGVWVRSEGSMKQVSGQWVVTGDVLNPVSGYELLQYAGMDWWQGVGSVEDMMRPTSQKSSWVTKLGLPATTYPAWTYYFECMIDDDQLQEDLALGRKVPYDLYNMLRFFDSCDREKVADWMTVWQYGAWRYMSLESAMAYTAFTDYLAAVDQRAKNMQPMFFLEDGAWVENGVYHSPTSMEPVRMYLNKIYDCDTCNGADNDGGRDIDPMTDPNKQTDETSGYTNPYMGSGSVLFRNIDSCPEVWNSDAGATTISLKSVVNRMRTQTAEISGKTMAPFSPAGAMYYFVEKRLKFWPKVISSYDGQRKYIDHTARANMPYFYALHGLGLTSLPRFIEERWGIRDGYYQTGDFFTNPLSGRVSAISSDSKIYITAAQTGYFGLGNDASGQLSETVFLEAGQSHAFTQFAHDAGALLYLYQPQRLKALDMSEMSLAFHFDDLSKLQLAEEITLGGVKHTANTSLNGFTALGSIVLGDMPFLRLLDVSGTTAKSVDAKGCPRVESILAGSTVLTSCTLAQTAPVKCLSLPATITGLDLVNLPELTYPGGMTIEGTSNITRLRIEGCPGIDTETLLLGAAKGGGVREVRVPGVNITASVEVLRKLRASGAVGIDASGNAYEETGQCSGITGRWILSELIDEETVEGKAGLIELIRYFPELELLNSQYSHIVFSDTVADSANITNMDDKTGYKYGTPYTVPGHWRKVDELSHTYRAMYNAAEKKMYLKQLSDKDYTKYADGTPFDPADSAGAGYDVMKMIYPHWRKGVNDYTAEEKHVFLSYGEQEPLSTASKITRKKLSEILIRSGEAVMLASNVTGEEYVTGENSSTNVYSIEVRGMRQVRWPAVNSGVIGAVFVDGSGCVVAFHSLNNGGALFDFIAGDYVFTDVPEGAERLVFTAPDGYDDEEAIAVDSDDVEAIEPDWVRIGTSLEKPGVRELAGVYGMGVDSLKRARSVSDIQTRTGVEYTISINQDWTYDESGDLTNTVVPNIEVWSPANLFNVCRMRGKGFYGVDYEMRLDIDNLVLGLLGDRDVQAKCGYGGYSRYITGGNGMNQYGNVTRRQSTSGTGNVIFGIQNYIGGNTEVQDNIGVNVSSVTAMRRVNYIEDQRFTNDYKCRIYDPVHGRERMVPLPADKPSGRCLARVRHGRYCDMLPSKATADTSLFNEYYCDNCTITGNKTMIPMRGGSSYSIKSGLAFIELRRGDQESTTTGVRLAFRGECVIEE